jgi:multiple sugar transport system permease protein
VAPATVGRRLSGRVSLWVLVVLFALFCAFPFLFAAITMFKQNTDLYTRPNGNQLTFTQAPTWSNLTLLFHHTPYGTFIVNNVIIGLCVVAITLALSVPAAYALARVTGRTGEKVGIGIFVVYLVPPTLLFLPLSQLVTLFGLQDSIWSLVVVYPSFTIPLSTWLLMGFFKSIPRDIEEQAQVDGYSRLGAVRRVVMPLALPGIFTVVVFTFTLTMQDFIYALSFVSSSSNMTVSVGVPTHLIRGDVFYWQALMASAIVIAVPVALLYNLFLDKFIQGFTMGAVKG